MEVAIHYLDPVNTAQEPVTIRADEEIGFAVQAGVMFKLPFIAAGDELWLQATYADGALDYAGVGATDYNRLTATRQRATDAYINRFGEVETAEAFSVSGKFLHYWMPNLRSNFFGGWQQIEYNGNASLLIDPIRAPGGPAVAVGYVDSRLWEVGANLIWTPVKQLDIGLEVVYRDLELDHRVAREINAGEYDDGGTFQAGGNVRRREFGSTIKRDDQLEARLRIQRDF